MSKLFANIKWIGGDDDGKVTVGIPTDWLMNFNYQEFLSENFDQDEPYVIDWREAGKEPPGGWPKFDGLVLDIAATVQALERKSINYVYPNSPRIVTPKTKTTVHPNDSTEASGSKKLATETSIDVNQTKCMVETMTMAKTYFIMTMTGEEGWILKFKIRIGSRTHQIHLTPLTITDKEKDHQFVMFPYGRNSLALSRKLICTLLSMPSYHV